MNLQIFFLFALTVLVCDAYKILLVFPFPSKSHAILGEGYVRNLLKAGHEVTYITPYPREPAPNLRIVHVSQRNFEEKIDHYFTVQKLLDNTITISDAIDVLTSFIGAANTTVTNEEVQKLMLDPNTTFDVVIAEWMLNEVFAGFSKIFGCPLIWSSSMEPHSMVLRLIDEVPHPAYSSNVLGLFEPPFNFFQRAINFGIEIGLQFTKCLSNRVEEPIYTEGFQEAFKLKGLTQPRLEEIRYSAAMIIGNSHVSSGAALRLPQNYKPIGGYHIPEDTKPLPEDFQKILDNSKHGVIYFSLGSIAESKSIPVAIKKGLFEMFSKIKYTVIWKFEEKFENISDNVHIVKWAPQQSILAHPNCVLFITHGGLLSTTETLHYGVPIIGIPLFGDQAMNVKKAVHKGFGLKVELDYDIPVNLKTAIDEIMSNRKYRDTVKHLSLIYHDRPVSPGAELVHWVEHVVKTRGALHLRSPALDVPLYQKLYFDLLAVVIVFVVSFVFLVKTVRSYSGKKKVVLSKKSL